MSESYEAATEICGSLELIRQELDYIGKQLDNSNLQDSRERIATAAMQGILSSPREFCGPDGETNAEYKARLALVSVEYADALIAELGKNDKTE